MTVPQSAERSFDRILARLTGVRRSGPNQATAMCPAHHNVSTAALSVTYFPELGETKTNCLAEQCSRREVLEAVGLPASAAYDVGPQPCEVCGKSSIPDAAGRYIHEYCATRTGRAATPRRRAAVKRQPRRELPSVGEGKRPPRLLGRQKKLGDPRVTAVFEYPDDDGTIVEREVRSEQLFEVTDGDQARQVVRKEFRPQWPDGRGGWITNHAPPGFVPILYGLPDVRQWVAQGRLIWLTEGCRDAECLLALGEAATTNPSGAGNFRASMAAVLAGANVKAVVDQDIAGYRRGLQLLKLLKDAARLEILLPATTENRSDVADHLAAGFGLDDFVPVSAEELATLVNVAQTREWAEDARECAAEAVARRQRAQAAKESSKDSWAAARWAREAGRLLAKVCIRIDEAGPVSVDQRAIMQAALESAQAAVRQAFEAAEVAIPDELEDYVEHQADPASAEDDGHTAAILEHPTMGRLPPPSHPFAMSRGSWAYEEGGPGLRPRGVYWDDDRVAPLPYVHARIRRVDGQGNPTGTSYLVSATPDSQPVVIGPDELRTHQWANIIGLVVPQDDRILRGATTALLFLAESAEIVEATPRFDGDRLTAARPETLPPGYLKQADISRAEALRIWARIVRLTAQNTRGALVLAAAGASTLVSMTKQQSHVVNLYGDPLRGKTTIFKVCAAMWGDPGEQGGRVGTLLSFNTTQLAVPALLGDLGVLPCFLDEIGQAGDVKDTQWHQLISNITQGAFRMTRHRNRPGAQISSPWSGIFFANGNKPMGPDASGANAGVPRRMIELDTPFTNDAEHAEALEVLHLQAYGHLGSEILSRATVETLLPLVEKARADLNLADLASDHQKAIGKHLALHVAGAMLIDQICGTGQTLYFAVLQAAADHLDECAEPQHDSEKALQDLTDWIAREPSTWPTAQHYVMLHKPKPEYHTPDQLPLHGYRGPYAGLRMPDGEVHVTREAWKQLVARLDITSRVALRRLYDRGLLRVQDSRRRKGEWVTQSGILRTDVYAIRLPAFDDDGVPDEDLPDVTPPARNRDRTPATNNPSPSAEDAVGGSAPPTMGVVGGAVGGTPNAVTRDVGGVGGVGGDSSRVGARVHVSEPAPTKRDENPNAGTAGADLDDGDGDGEQEDPTMATRFLDRGGYAGWSTHLETGRECVICGQISVIEINDLAIHIPCWERSTQGERARRLAERHDETSAASGSSGVQPPPSTDAGWTPLPRPYPNCVVCDSPAGQALAGLPLHHGECEDELTRRQTPVAPPARPAAPGRRAVAAEGPRFIADSAVLDVDGAWFSNGTQIPLPPAANIGDFAAWALEQRLGFGGNKNHYPEPGHVWLMPNLCARYELPTGPFETMREADEALAVMRRSRFVVDAEADGWEVLVDVKQPWLRLRRDRRTVIITGAGWGCGRYDLLMRWDPSAQELAGRLGYLCKLVGYPYTVSLANTGVLTLAYHTTHGLSPVELPNIPYNDVAANPSWFDQASLEELARAHPDWTAHKYDRRASYAAAAGSAHVGTGPGLHHPDGCNFDKRAAGLYRIAPLGTPAIPQLPGFDLRDPKGGGQASGWLSRSAVQFLIELGAEPEILEAYTWDPANSGAQLKSWQALIRDARRQLAVDVHDGSPYAIAINGSGPDDPSMFKQIYAGAIGKLAPSVGGLEPAWRRYPHWRAEIIGTHTVNTLRAVLRIHRNDPEHRLPVAIGDTDALVFVGPSPDPADVWPMREGPDSLSNADLGKYKPAASIGLGRWMEAIEAESSAAKPVSRLQLIGKAGRQWTT